MRLTTQDADLQQIDVLYHELASRAALVSQVEAQLHAIVTRLVEQEARIALPYAQLLTRVHARGQAMLTLLYRYEQRLGQSSPTNDRTRRNLFAA